MTEEKFELIEGMVSVFSVVDWQHVVATFFIIVLLMPYSSNRTIRYYGCYIFYVLYISTTGLLLVPIFLLRPKNVINLTIAGAVFKHFTKVLGIKWHTNNEAVLNVERGAVIVANHQSILDVMGMWTIWEAMGRCTVVAKKEIIYVFPFGVVAWLAGLVYIDRSNPKVANEQLNKATTLIKNDKTKLWLYPEGTRNHVGGKLLPFKKGAFRTAIESKVPIIPIVFSPYYFIDSKKKYFDKGDMFISVLEPISTENLTAADVEDITNLTYERMSAEYKMLGQKAAALKKAACDLR